MPCPHYYIMSQVFIYLLSFFTLFYLFITLFTYLAFLFKIKSQHVDHFGLEAAI